LGVNRRRIEQIRLAMEDLGDYWLLITDY
jgi:uncharacterized protein (DUF1499 family)